MGPRKGSESTSTVSKLRLRRRHSISGAAEDISHNTTQPENVALSSKSEHTEKDKYETAEQFCEVIIQQITELILTEYQSGKTQDGEPFDSIAHIANAAFRDVREKTEHLKPQRDGNAESLVGIIASQMKARRDNPDLKQFYKGDQPYSDNDIQDLITGILDIADRRARVKLLLERAYKKTTEDQESPSEEISVLKNLRTSEDLDPTDTYTLRKSDLDPVQMKALRESVAINFALVYAVGENDKADSFASLIELINLPAFNGPDSTFESKVAHQLALVAAMMRRVERGFLVTKERIDDLQTKSDIIDELIHQGLSKLPLEEMTPDQRKSALEQAFFGQRNIYTHALVQKLTNNVRDLLSQRGGKVSFGYYDIIANCLGVKLVSYDENNTQQSSAIEFEATSEEPITPAEGLDARIPSAATTANIEHSANEKGQASNDSFRVGAIRINRVGKGAATAALATSIVLGSSGVAAASSPIDSNNGHNREAKDTTITYQPVSYTEKQEKPSRRKDKTDTVTVSGSTTEASERPNERIEPAKEVSTGAKEEAEEKSNAGSDTVPTVASPQDKKDGAVADDDSDKHTRPQKDEDKGKNKNTDGKAPDINDGNKSTVNDFDNAEVEPEKQPTIIRDEVGISDSNDSPANKPNPLSDESVVERGKEAASSLVGRIRGVLAPDGKHSKKPKQEQSPLADSPLEKPAEEPMHDPRAVVSSLSEGINEDKIKVKPAYRSELPRHVEVSDSGINVTRSAAVPPTDGKAHTSPSKIRIKPSKTYPSPQASTGDQAATQREAVAANHERRYRDWELDMAVRNQAFTAAVNTSYASAARAKVAQVEAKTGAKAVEHNQGSLVIDSMGKALDNADSAVDPTTVSNDTKMARAILAEAKAATLLPAANSEAIDKLAPLPEGSPEEQALFQQYVDGKIVEVLSGLFPSDPDGAGEVYTVDEKEKVARLVVIADLYTKQPDKRVDHAKNELANLQARAAVYAPAAAETAPAAPEVTITITHKEVTQALMDKKGEWVNKGYVLRFFMDNGFNLEQSAGIVGNLIHESGLDSKKSQLKGGPGRGLAQWEEGGPRFAKLKEFAKPQDKSWHDLDVQLGFIMYEFNTTEKVALEAVRAAGSVEEATRLFEEKFERAGSPQLDRRLKHAEDLKLAFNAAHLEIYEASKPKIENAAIPNMPDGVEILNDLKNRYDDISGKLDASELEKIGGPWGDHKLHPAASLAFRTLNHHYRSKFGVDIALTDSYRSYEGQVKTKEKWTKKGKPDYAATPGKSNHGWALAVDLGGGIQQFSTEQHTWMREHAPKFGWILPEWANDGTGIEEPWHWEFRGSSKAVKL